MSFLATRSGDMANLFDILFNRKPKMEDVFEKARQNCYKNTALTKQQCDDAFRSSSK